MLHPIALHVNNDEAVDVSNTPFYTQRQAMSPEADIILAIHVLCSELTNNGGNPHIQWTISHQDNDRPSSSLSPTSQLNVDMDIASKQSRVNNTITHTAPYPGSGAMLIIKDQWVTTKNNEKICDALIEAIHCTYFMKKYRLTLTTYDDVDWTVIGCARDSLSLSVNLNLTKMLNDWLNTGKQLTHMHQIGKCPCCGWHKIKQLHMFQCQHPAMTWTR